MLSISVICATPPLPNPGMDSVDLALQALFARHNLAAELRTFRLYSPEQRNNDIPSGKRQRFNRLEKSPIRYLSCLNNIDAVMEADAIVFWGDFLHSREFVHQVGNVIQSIQPELTDDQALQDAYSHLLLIQASTNVLQRTLSYGSTLIFNRARDYMDDTYVGHLTRFAGNVRRMWLRDAHSLPRIAQLAPQGRCELGVDCSLFLRQHDLYSLCDVHPPKSASPPMAGVFFGRNHRHIQDVGHFTNDVCREMKVVPEWVAWFDAGLQPNHVPAIAEAVQGLRINNVERKNTELIARLEMYDFVITDTYHLCVNSWRCGVPAICIGEAIPTEAFDVSTGWQCAWRDKRHAFLSMYDAMEFYIFGEELADELARQNRVLYTAHLLRESSVVDAILHNIECHVKRSEEQFVKELLRLLQNKHSGTSTDP